MSSMEIITTHPWILPFRAPILSSFKEPIAAPIFKKEPFIIAGHIIFQEQQEATYQKNICMWLRRDLFSGRKLCGFAFRTHLTHLTWGSASDSAKGFAPFGNPFLIAYAVLGLPYSFSPKVGNAFYTKGVKGISNLRWEQAPGDGDSHLLESSES